MLKPSLQGKIKGTCHTLFSNYVYVWLFAMLVALFSAVLSFVIAEHNGIIRGLLFFNYHDVGMDHFNSVMATARRTPYTEHHITYPPLAAMFYYLFYLVVDKDLTTQILHGSLPNFSLRESSTAMVSYMMYVIVCVLAIVTLLQKNLRVSEGKRTAAVFGVFFSVGFLSIVDRGNNALFITVLLLYYVCYYNSENKILSETALLALALATGFKLYPVVFGVLLIRRHKIFKGFRAVLYIVLALFLPFFFFEGFAAIGCWIERLFPATREVPIHPGALNFVSVIRNIEVAFRIDIPDFLVAVFPVLFIVGGLVMAITFKKDYKAMLFCVFAILGFAGVTFRYFLFLSIIPVMHLFTKCDTVRDRIWAVLLLFINLPIATKVPEFLKESGFFLTDLISSFLTLAILVYLLVDGAIDLYAYIKDGRYRYLFKTEEQMKNLGEVPTWVE